jgi:hypothetical protein
MVFFEKGSNGDFSNFGAAECTLENSEGSSGVLWWSDEWFPIECSDCMQLHW